VINYFEAATMNIPICRSLAVPVAIALLLFPLDAQAYVGPGAGLTAFGSLFAFIGAILLALVGFVWYPIKRLLRMARRRTAPDAEREISS
jgi:hypothetical protein